MDMYKYTEINKVLMDWNPFSDDGPIYRTNTFNPCTGKRNWFRKVLFVENDGNTNETINIKINGQ